MLTSTIIQARTLKNDFPTGLLVYPNNFSHEKVKWARDYIANSTRFFEFASPEGRRVIFADRSTLITGVSINIKDLYILCGKEPRYSNVEVTRTNYAFIGFAIPKTEISYAFDIPYTLFLEQYEKYMQELWEKPFQENGFQGVESDYYNIDFPSAKDVFTFPAISATERMVVDEKSVGIESICAGITMAIKDYNDIGFCSGVPNARCVVESKFAVVSARDSDRIKDRLKAEFAAEEQLPQGEPQKSKRVPFAVPNPKEVFGGLKKRWDEKPKEEKKKFIAWGSAALSVGGLLIKFIKKN